MYRHVVIDQIGRRVDRAALGKYAYLGRTEQAHFTMPLTNIRAARVTIFALVDSSALRDRYLAIVPNEI